VHHSRPRRSLVDNVDYRAFEGSRLVADLDEVSEKFTIYTLI